MLALLSGTGKSELYVYAVKTEDLRPLSLQFIVIMHIPGVSKKSIGV